MTHLAIVAFPAIAIAAGLLSIRSLITFVVEIYRARHEGDLT